MGLCQQNGQRLGVGVLPTHLHGTHTQEPIPDACTYYTPTSSRMYSTVSWQDTLQPRLLAGPEPGERELLLLAWNGRDHFDAVLRR